MHACIFWPDPGIKPSSPVSPALAGRFFTTVPSGKPFDKYSISVYCIYIHMCIYIYSICIVYQSYLIHIDTHTILILSKIYINIFSALIIYFFIVYSVAQSCPTLCSPVNCTVHQAPFHGIFQARIPEQVAISCSRRSSQPRDQTHISCVSCIGRQILYHFATWESLIEKGIHAPVQS